MQTLAENVTITFSVTNQVDGSSIQPLEVFTCSLQSSHQDFSCVFFDFDIRAFSTEGVQTRMVEAEDNRITFECTSNHLTSFAVLVNVGGVDVS